MSRALTKTTLTITANGSGAGSDTTELPGGPNGFLWSIHLTYSGGFDSTNVVSFSDGRSLLTVTDNTDDGAFPVRLPAVGVDGDALDGQYTFWELAGDQITMSLSGAAEDDVVTADIYIFG